MANMTIHAFRQKILRWYRVHKREMPWRTTRNPYRILVSEVMLQQTQLSRVLAKYDEFLLAFPTIQALAKARDSKLFSVWSGLGYWRRARFLKETAIQVVHEFNGKFPRTPKKLAELPGIGSYTAGAVACFAFGSAEPFIDTNIRRTYIHFIFPHAMAVRDRDILPIARKAVWKKDPRMWHWALFDYGAIELKRSLANRKSVHHIRQSKFEGSFRSYRAKTIRHILDVKKIHRDEILDWLEDTLKHDERDYSARDILESLIVDNIVKKEADLIRI